MTQAKMKQPPYRPTCTYSLSLQRMQSGNGLWHWIPSSHLITTCAANVENFYKSSHKAPDNMFFFPVCINCQHVQVQQSCHLVNIIIHQGCKRRQGIGKKHVLVSRMWALLQHPVLGARPLGKAGLHSPLRLVLTMPAWPLSQGTESCTCLSLKHTYSVSLPHSMGPFPGLTLHSRYSNTCIV